MDKLSNQEQESRTTLFLLHGGDSRGAGAGYEFAGMIGADYSNRKRAVIISLADHGRSRPGVIRQKDHRVALAPQFPESGSTTSGTAEAAIPLAVGCDFAMPIARVATGISPAAVFEHFIESAAFVGSGTA